MFIVIDRQRGKLDPLKGYDPHRNDPRTTRYDEIYDVRTTREMGRCGICTLMLSQRICRVWAAKPIDVKVYICGHPSLLPVTAIASLPKITRFRTFQAFTQILPVCYGRYIL